MARLQEAAMDMRRKALAAALRNINLHVFGGRANSKRLEEYVAERMKLRPIDIRLWCSGDGVPEAYIDEFLSLLNENSVWCKHQIRPSQKLVEACMEKNHA
ncbi:hypothetical protein FYU92_06470 [Vibrio cholerae]|uniref:hypothetical protein n=1 Tax=Vibrio cholerae TaxID=666 RepID=UPI001D3415E9|nr:hypothetical protein [Vibrio cholerae]EGR1038374.1 hypothetical protein [Vibrio cholerae]